MRALVVAVATTGSSGNAAGAACHAGNPGSSTEIEAHEGLIAFPGDLATAERDFGRAIQLAPQQPLPYLGMCEVEGRRERPVQALEHCRRARERAPEARIGFFLHIPFPPLELFSRLPWRNEVIEGLLGCDLLGFQRPMGMANFAACAHQFVEADESLRRQLALERSRMRELEAEVAEERGAGAEGQRVVEW